MLWAILSFLLIATILYPLYSHKKPFRNVIILRGASGSGKSTKAAQLISISQSIGEEAIIISADDYFVREGLYIFDRAKLKEAMKLCHLQLKEALEEGFDTIIIDNTNTTEIEVRIFKEIVKKYNKKSDVNYRIIEELVGTIDFEDAEKYWQRNIHGVPLKVIQQQIKRLKKKL